MSKIDSPGESPNALPPFAGYRRGRTRGKAGGGVWGRRFPPGKGKGPLAPQRAVFMAATETPARRQRRGCIGFPRLTFRWRGMAFLFLSIIAFRTRTDGESPIKVQSPATHPAPYGGPVGGRVPWPWVGRRWASRNLWQTPSSIIHAGLRKSPKLALFTLLIRKGKCEKKKQRSLDCGKHFGANLIPDPKGKKVANPPPLAKSPRELQKTTRKKNTGRKAFLGPMETKTIDRPHLEGGAEKPQKRKRPGQAKESVENDFAGTSAWKSEDAPAKFRFNTSSDNAFTSPTKESHDPFPKTPPEKQQTLRPQEVSSRAAADGAAGGPNGPQEEFGRSIGQETEGELTSVEVPLRSQRQAVRKGGRWETAISAGEYAHTTPKSQPIATPPVLLFEVVAPPHWERDGVATSQKARNTAFCIFRQARGIKGKLAKRLGVVFFGFAHVSKEG